jgi:hypothetical protein
MGGTCSTFGGEARILVGIPGVKRSLGRPWSRWEDNIKMDIQEMGWGHGMS